MKSQRKRLFETLRHRVEGNIKIDLNETGREYVKWLHLAQRSVFLSGSFEHGNEL